MEFIMPFIALAFWCCIIGFLWALAHPRSFGKFIGTLFLKGTNGGASKEVSGLKIIGQMIVGVVATIIFFRIHPFSIFLMGLFWIQWFRMMNKTSKAEEEKDAEHGNSQRVESAKLRVISNPETRSVTTDLDPHPAFIPLLPPQPPVASVASTAERAPQRSKTKRAVRIVAAFVFVFMVVVFLIAKGLYRDIGGMAGINDIQEHISPSMKPVVEAWLDADLAVPMNWTDARPILPPCPNPGTVDGDRALHDRKCSVILDYSGDRFLFIGWEIPARDRQAAQDLGSVIDEIREQRGSDYVLSAARMFDPKRFFATPFHEGARTSPPEDNASVANDKTPLQSQGNGTGPQPGRALEHDPAESKRLNIQGLQLLKASNPDLNSVESAFEKAVQLDPTNIQALNNLGYTYSRLGDFRSAEPILIKVLEMAPTRKVAQGNLGYVEAKLGKTSDAANHFCEYVRLFDSMDRGKAILKRTMTDNDSNVQIAVNATIVGCGPRPK